VGGGAAEEDEGKRSSEEEPIQTPTTSRRAHADADAVEEALSG